MEMGDDAARALGVGVNRTRITAMVANVDGRSNRKTRRGKRIYKSDGSSYRFHLVG